MQTQGRSENFQEGVSSLKCFKEKKIGNIALQLLWLHWYIINNSKIWSHACINITKLEESLLKESTGPCRSCNETILL